MLVHYGFAWALAIFYMGQAGVIINLVLCVLNFLPIPPLDGSHILLGILPRNIAIYYERIAPAGFVILLILLALGWLSRVIQVPTDFLLNLFHSVFGV
jgi:Zn-dependent protease